MKVIKEMAKQRNFKIEPLTNYKGKGCQVITENATYKVLKYMDVNKYLVEVYEDGWEIKDFTCNTQKEVAEQIRMTEWLTEHKYEESQKMYNDIKANIKELSPISRTEINWYKFVTNIINLSDDKANEVLWEQRKDNQENIDWSKTYDELDILHKDKDIIIAMIEDELHEVY